MVCNHHGWAGKQDCAAGFCDHFLGSLKSKESLFLFLWLRKLLFEIPIEIFQFNVKFLGNVPNQVTARIFITDKGYLGNKFFDQFGFLKWILVHSFLNHFDAKRNDILTVVFDECLEGFCAMFQDI